MTLQERINLQAAVMTEDEITAEVQRLMEIADQWNDLYVQYRYVNGDVAALYQQMCRDASHEAALWCMA